MAYRKTATFVLLVVSGIARQGWGQVNAGRSVQQQQQLQELQQLELDTRLLANPSIPPGQRALIQYGGYFSPQYYSVDDFNNNNHGLVQSQLVAYFRAVFDGANEVFLRGSTEYNAYTPGDSFDGLGSRLIDPDFDRAFYRFDLQQYDAAYKGRRDNYDITFEAGRDLTYWGNGLVIGQVLDGISPTFSYGNLSVATVAGVTPLRTVDFEPDRPEFSFNTRRGFYGLMASVAVGQFHPYVYGLFQQDYNQENQSVIGPITTRYSYNSNYLGAGFTGDLSDHLHIGVEGVFESGNTLSDSSMVDPNTGLLTPVPQTRDNIRAYAADAKLDFVPQDPHNSRFSLEGIIATGDRDRGLTNTTFNGNAPNTPDKAFNSFGLVTAGLAFAAPISNLVVARAGASTFPLSDFSAFRRLQVGADIYWFNKESAAAPLDEPTSPGVTYLGYEPDVYLNWDVASDVTLTVRYGIFFPNGSAFPSDKPRQFVYTGAVFAF